MNPLGQCTSAGAVKGQDGELEGNLVEEIAPAGTAMSRGVADNVQDGERQLCPVDM